MQEDNCPSLRIVNGHYQLWLGRPINLQTLSEVVGKNGRLHRGRPTMMSCRLLKKRVLFFPNGGVQVIGGGVTKTLLNHLLRKIDILLRLCSVTAPPCQLQWTVNNIVFQFNLHRRFKFDRYKCNKDFSFEPELFPAALISRWIPAHVTLFSNGRGMITGVKERSTAVELLRKLPAFLTEHANSCGLRGRTDPGVECFCD